MSAKEVNYFLWLGNKIGIREMIVFCEECGERYVIEADEMKGSAMIFICRNCNDIIRIPVQKPHHKQEEKAKSEAEKV